MKHTLRAGIVGATAIVVVSLNPWTDKSRDTPDEPVAASLLSTTSTIVQGGDAVQLATALHAVGASVSRELPLIGAVSTELTATQHQALAEHYPELRLSASRELRVASMVPLGEGETTTSDHDADAPQCISDLETTHKPARKEKNKHRGNPHAAVQVHEHDGGRSHFPSHIGADSLHVAGIDGRGVGIAVIDTGLWREAIQHFATDRTLPVKRQILAMDMVGGQERVMFDGQCFQEGTLDNYGHGTHVSTVAASSVRAEDGSFQGVAPMANLYSLRAFDGQGAGSYVDVIAAIQWVVEHRDTHNIRVLNLSFSADPQSWYWEDPLNQAVMAAWAAGIVVVTSSGNTGPDPMTVGVPGNVPYVITVGAMSDNYSPYGRQDDFLTHFSSAGPTLEGHVKPDVMAPGAHMLGIVPAGSYLDETYGEENSFEFGPDDQPLGDNFFVMSGTSQATAVVAGAAALLLQQAPELTPDAVKCRLMSTSRMLRDEQGSPTYSVFQQGAGLIDVLSASSHGIDNCANQGLDIQADLAGIQHYHGPAVLSLDGQYHIAEHDQSGYPTGRPVDDAYLTWSGAYPWDSGAMWGDGYPWGTRTVWADGYPWGVRPVGLNGYPWGVRPVGLDGYPWGVRPIALDGYPWGVRPIGVDGYPWGVRPIGLDGYPWGVRPIGVDGYPWGVRPVWTDGYPWGTSFPGVVNRTSISTWIQHASLRD